MGIKQVIAVVLALLAYLASVKPEVSFEEKLLEKS
jgi:hypothetical protein